MINLRIERLEDERSRQIEISGHAGYAEKGKDIVCAAVSILSQAFLSYLQDLYNRNRIEYLDYEIEDGHIVIHYSEFMAREQDISGGESVFDNGMEMLLKAYPNYMKKA